MLNMMSKILILGIIMCLASLSHAIKGSLDENEYHVAEGGTLEVTCTVINQNDTEDIWWLIRYGNSAWYQSATSYNMSEQMQPNFFESFELEMDGANKFIFRMINISRNLNPTLTCGYYHSSAFAVMATAKIRIWVEPKCTQNSLIPDIITSGQYSTTLNCTTGSYSNPSRGLQWYENGDTRGSPMNDNVHTAVTISANDRGKRYVCKVDSTTVNLTCEIIPYNPTLPLTTELQTTELATETIFMTQTTELALTETANQTNSTEPVDGFWSNMIIIVVAAPGGTIVLIFIIIIVVCLCSCIKHNKTNKNIDVESGSETYTKSDTKTLAAKTHDTATTNGGMKMNDTNEMKNGKTEMRKDDAIPVYDDVANGDNAEKTDKPNGEPMNNGQVKEAENMDKNGEEIPLYDNMRDDTVEKPDMSKANVEGLEYADIAIGSTMDGPPNSEDIIRKESATVYADLMV